MHQQRRHYGQAAQSESGGGIFSGLGENARPATGNQQQVQQRRHYGSAASNLQDTSLVPHRAERPAWQVNLPRSTVHERTSHVGDDKLLTDDVGNARCVWQPCERTQSHSVWLMSGTCPIEDRWGYACDPVTVPPPSA